MSALFPTLARLSAALERRILGLSAGQGLQTGCLAWSHFRMENEMANPRLTAMKKLLGIVLFAASFVPVDLRAQESVDLPSYAAPELRWQDHDIPVCGENLQPSQSIEAMWVKEALASTWERHSSLRFIGWSVCEPGSRGIRIRVDDTNPRSLVGNLLDGEPDGMHLNFSFSAWSPVCSAPANREQCIKSIAIHEFGHAIGLFHEQDRQDTPSHCRDQNVTNPQMLQFARTYGFMVGTYDPYSVMNYCANNSVGSGLALSAGDIQGLAFLTGEMTGFLVCVVRGARDPSCCGHLSEAEIGNFAVCSNRTVPDEERLNYYRLCIASNSTRCCDHLTVELARSYAAQACPG
jgi:Astacin (Peptidase family M12A)